MKIIKKYDNRCLYDSDLSANITLQDLKQYVIDHVPFKVVHAKTDEDLTRSYLVQIILELEVLEKPLFTQDSLETIIRFYGHPLQDTIKSGIGQAMAMMEKQYTGYQEAMDSTCKDDVLASISALTAKNLKVWQDMWAPTSKKD